MIEKKKIQVAKWWTPKKYLKQSMITLIIYQSQVRIFLSLEVSVFGFSIQADQVFGTMQFCWVVNDQGFQKFATLQKYRKQERNVLILIL